MRTVIRPTERRDNSQIVMLDEAGGLSSEGIEVTPPPSVKGRFFFRDTKGFGDKIGASSVTRADQTVESEIRCALAKHFPVDGI